MVNRQTSLQPSLASRPARVIIAFVRVCVALLWMQNVAWKVPPDFGKESNSGLWHWANQALEHPVFAPYTWMVQNTVLPNFTVFGWLVLLIEGGLAAFLLVGFLTRFWAVVGLAQTLAITFSVLNTPNEWHWSYYLMFLVHLMLIVTAAGRSYGVDGLVRQAIASPHGRLSALYLRLS
jgi:thiosulfate dehydrogenase [quinone] large subunit